MAGTKKIPIKLAASMPPMTVVPMIWRATEYECERRHQNRSQTKPGAFERRIRQRLSFLVLALGKLDDQNRVLRCQADEHDQSDLRVDIVLDLDQVGRQENAQEYAAQPKDSKGSEDRHGGAQQHAERQRPAFIE